MTRKSSTGRIPTRVLLSTRERSIENKKIRKGDNVVCTTGNDKGKTGKVLSRFVDRDHIRYRNEYVVVQGLNLRKKAVKASEANKKGGFVDIEAPIHISNVRLCDESGKPIRLKCTYNKETSNRELYYMKGAERVMYRSIKAAVS